jgi:FkbM family methyltransferase
VLKRRYPNVDVRPEALSDTVGLAEFTFVANVPALSGLSATLEPRREMRDVRTVQVPVATLDGSLPPGYRPALVKIDVEGAEWGVLRGAQATLSKHRPLVAFEHQHGAAKSDAEKRAGSQRIYEFFEQLGMRLFDMDGEEYPHADDFLRVTCGGARWNFVARC